MIPDYARGTRPGKPHLRRFVLGDCWRCIQPDHPLQPTPVGFGPTAFEAFVHWRAEVIFAETMSCVTNSAIPHL